MRNVRRLLKPGGRLLLLEVSDILLVKLMMSSLPGWWLGGDDGRRYEPMIFVSDWHSLLLSTGFSGVDHTVNDFVDASRYMNSVMLTQAVDDDIRVLRQPLTSRGDWLSGRSVTIVGGKRSTVARRVSKTLLAINGPLDTVINLVEGFDKTPSELPSMRSVLVLEDLDGPLFQTLTPGKLAGLQRAVNESRQVLWVSSGCRRQEPYANMSIGLCRSLAAEFHHIQMQHIDVEESDLAPLVISRIAEAMARLVFKSSDKDSDVLWSIEPELILEQGRWLIPRILPDDQLNDQLSASKMTIQTQSSLATTVVQVGRRRGEFVVTQPPPSLRAPEAAASSNVQIRVALPFLISFRADNGAPVYLCYGHEDGDPATQLLAVSTTSSSRICTPQHCVFDCSGAISAAGPLTMLRKVAFAVTAAQLLSGIDAGATIVLHEGDQFLGAAVRWKAAELGLKCVSTTFTSPTQHSGEEHGTLFIHPQAPERDVKKLVPCDTIPLIDFSDNVKTHGASGSSMLRRYLPACCKFAAIQDLFGGDDDSTYMTRPSAGVAKRVEETIRSSLGFDLTVDGPVIRASELSGQLVLDAHYSSVVNFAAVQPLNGSLLFQPDKTYMLVGCIGGLGQALCRWMVSVGVRHLALTTRNVSRVDTSWLKELRLRGAHFRLFQVDVSDKKVLEAVHAQVSREMPPISGVAHAAMVLSDRSFGELQVSDFATMFGPKVQGTQNLHELFHDQQLDFFVMFSSLASIVGNRGQSNYAAANLFMSAVAEQRRARNLAASVMHIGMVLSVGYVSSRGTYEAALRQYNYMPISEPDFLNMFA